MQSTSFQKLFFAFFLLLLSKSLLVAAVRYQQFIPSTTEFEELFHDARLSFPRTIPKVLDDEKPVITLLPQQQQQQQQQPLIKEKPNSYLIFNYYNPTDHDALKEAIKSNDQSFFKKYRVISFLNKFNSMVSLEKFERILKAFAANIAKLDLRNVKIDDHYLKYISENCENIIEIDLTKIGEWPDEINDPFVRVTENGFIEYLEKLTTLRCLKLGNWLAITKNELASLATLPNLQYLDLHGCRKITNSDLELVATFKKLRYLDLSDCEKIGDEGIAQLSILQNLTTLKLSGCHTITIAGLKRLNTFPSLKQLFTCNCFSNALKTLNDIPKTITITIDHACMEESQ